jgi:hypothetical protein
MSQWIWSILLFTTNRIVPTKVPQIPPKNNSPENEGTEVLQGAFCGIGIPHFLINENKYMAIYTKKCIELLLVASYPEIEGNESHGNSILLRCRRIRYIAQKGCMVEWFLLMPCVVQIRGMREHSRRRHSGHLACTIHAMIRCIFMIMYRCQNADMGPSKIYMAMPRGVRRSFLPYAWYSD